MNNFFDKLRIMDGGTGQQLINKGLEPEGNLWSATALLYEKYNKLIFDTHLEFIDSGAEVILTNTFGARKRRLLENNLIDKYKSMNELACEIAKKAVLKSNKKVLIAGSLPPQNFTYQADLGDDLSFISNAFMEQASFLYKNIDFFYLDVMCSKLECEIAINSIKKFNKEFVIGLHIKEKGLLPSGENFFDVAKELVNYKPMAITASCISDIDYEFIEKDISKLPLPYGFKFNAFEQIPEGWKPDGNNTSLLGRRKEMTPDKFLEVCTKYASLGAKLVGGCCEITPKHISKLKILKNNI